MAWSSAAEYCSVGQSGIPRAYAMLSPFGENAGDTAEPARTVNYRGDQSYQAVPLPLGR